MNNINRFAVIDQTTGAIVKDEFKSKHDAQRFIDRQSNHGFFNYSVEAAPWNVDDDGAE